MRINKWLIIPFALIIAAVAVWTVRDWLSVPTVDAQAAIQDACEGADFQSAHLIMNGTDTLDGEVLYRFRWEMKNNGYDSYRHTRDLDSGHQTELYIVGGYSYNRSMDDQGEWGSWRVKEVNFPEPEPTGPVGRVDDADDAAPVFCGLNTLKDHKYIGEVQLSGQKVKHFSAKVDDDEVDSDWEFWISNLGRVTKFSADETYPDRSETEIEGTITYPTQPFTITAPTVP